MVCVFLQFDSERDIVVSGSLDTTIKIWNIRDGVCTQTLTGHQSLTSGMQLRGNILVSGNADSTIKVRVSRVQYYKKIKDQQLNSCKFMFFKKFYPNLWISYV